MTLAEFIEYHRPQPINVPTKHIISFVETFLYNEDWKEEWCEDKNYSIVYNPALTIKGPYFSNAQIEALYGIKAVKLALPENIVFVTIDEEASSAIAEPEFVSIVQKQLQEFVKGSK